ncbi:MAG: cytochrome c biogenesis protein CcdA [Candidatus Babeliales bacterium]|nr:cytochrome c biogenesis protein CcdA [Candidatus Babeliales bacterium]
MKKFTALFLLNFFIVCISANNIEIKTETIDLENAKINISVPVKNKDIIFKEFLNISSNNPNIELSNIQFKPEPVMQYVPAVDKQILVFNKDFNILLNAKKKNEISGASNLFLSYYRNNQDAIEEHSLEIELFKKIEVPAKPQTDEPSSPNVQSTKKIAKHNSEKTGFWNNINKLSTYVQDTIKTNNSMTLRFFLVFLLGLLMSLTPCIYPMIPITAGILQAQGSKSVFKNLLLSLSYTFGIATTFAVFGLSAALTGNLFGKILMHPVFILFIVAVLAYFAFAMLGFYELYIPNSMQTGASANVNGSYISAFIFGAISGSVASPCLSPGLALLLSIVATLGSKFLGFMLLFTFGMGLGIPLLIIGTFSSSLNVLPRSGFWMVEIKKLFAFMLFGMCFYFLSNIIAYNKLIWLIAAFILASGIYYLKNISVYDSKLWRVIKNIIGIGLCAFSIVLFFKAYQQTFYPQSTVIAHSELWMANYDEANQKALSQSKKLFIDIGADFCSLCKAIDSQLFNNAAVKEKLSDFVTVKVDATDEASYPYHNLKTSYDIIGVPTILVIDPSSKALIKKWGGELYNITPEEFIEELEIITND